MALLFLCCAGFLLLILLFAKGSFALKLSDSKILAIKIAALVLAVVLIFSSVFIVRSCSAPPDYSEISARVEELVMASYDVNDVIWGAGVPTYERIYDPKASMSLYESGKTVTDADGNEQPLNYHYYYALSDSERTVVAFRRQKDYSAPYRYAYISDSELDSAALASIFPLNDASSADSELYSLLYSDAEGGKFAYLVPYVEPTYDFYYTAADPVDYDYILADSALSSVDEIKAFVRTVYSDSYADSLDSVLFDGVLEGDFIQKARYASYNGSGGTPMLASLNTYKPLFTERRVYLFDTARIDRDNSNTSSVQVVLLSYLPSKPENRLETKLSFALQDGEWFLATPTY